MLTFLACLLLLLVGLAGGRLLVRAGGGRQASTDALLELTRRLPEAQSVEQVAALLDAMGDRLMARYRLRLHLGAVPPGAPPLCREFHAPFAPTFQAALTGEGRGLPDERERHVFELVASTLDLALMGRLSDQERLSLEKLSAVAKTTQMLAHDVRKPFTMVQALLRALEEAADQEEMQRTARQYLPAVDRALVAINGMLADITEISARSAPRPEPTNPESLIESTLVENLRFAEGSDVKLRYELRHEHLVEADTVKVARVFGNIVANALQATGRDGTLWFATRDVVRDGRRYVRFTVGNSGSYVAPEDRALLFEAFYTKDKPGGTGLGLAIAKKIVGAHGGWIWCTSERGVGTEFHFTLPASAQLRSPYVCALPEAAREIRERYGQAPRDADDAGASGGGDALTRECQLEAQIAAARAAAGGPLRVLIADDEPLYRNALRRQMLKAEALRRHVELEVATTAEDALALAGARRFHLIFMDIDFGAGRMSGLEAVGALRRAGCAARVVVHSNRITLEAQTEALAAGADVYMPKPVLRVHVLGVMAAAASTAEADAGGEPAGGDAERHVIVLDDDPFVLFHWESVEQTRIRTFASPEELWARSAEEPELLGAAVAVVTDHWFGEGARETGLELARKLKERGYAGPIFLASDGEFHDAELAGVVAAKVPKLASEALAAMRMTGSCAL